LAILETSLSFSTAALIGSIFLYSYSKELIMRSILYVIAVICIIGWLLGMFVWSATGLIHVLLVIAVIALILALIRRA
jgi:hypothetical protein